MEKGGVIYIRKYYLIAMQISVVCPMLIPTFLEHMDIPQVKNWLGMTEMTVILCFRYIIGFITFQVILVESISS